LNLAKTYFTDPGKGYSGALVEEGEGFARFEIFRGHLAVAASQDGEHTRVRCSTLRYHTSIGQFLLMLETETAVPGS
jgi:hypothetical protein